LEILLLKILGFWVYLFVPTLGISFGIPLLFSIKKNRRLLGTVLVVVVLGSIGFVSYLAWSQGEPAPFRYTIVPLVEYGLWSCLEGFASRKWGQKPGALALATLSRCLNAIFVFYATIDFVFQGM
jgi:hypothetical protein